MAMGSVTDKPSAAARRLPLRLSLGLAAAIVLDTAVQTIWKHAASILPENVATHPAQAIAILLHQPVFLAVAVLIALQMINWLKVLDDADVSFALPITALSYISVTAVSAVWLHEAVTPGRIAGMALILAGVFLVSRTDHITTAPAIPPGVGGSDA
jgi:drug/metabolite transporter (DMT)-like permease